MKPDFSETSFGYALTAELIHRFNARALGPPEFLSTRKEGLPGGGWDMRLGPIFLQFKVPTVITRRYSRRPEPLTPPSYRMYLHRRRGWRQHELLVSLERERRFVRYAAPRFDTTDDFASAYATNTVAPQSIFVAPASLPMPFGSSEHYVAYSRSDPRAFFCTDPVEISAPIDGAVFLDEVERAIREGIEKQPGRLADTLEIMKRLVEGSWLRSATAVEEVPAEAEISIRDVVAWGVPTSEVAQGKSPEVTFAWLSNLPVDQQIGFLAEAYFGAIALLI